MANNDNYCPHCDATDNNNNNYYQVDCNGSQPPLQPAVSEASRGGNSISEKRITTSITANNWKESRDKCCTCKQSLLSSSLRANYFDWPQQSSAHKLAAGIRGKPDTIFGRHCCRNHQHECGQVNSKLPIEANTKFYLLDENSRPRIHPNQKKGGKMKIGDHDVNIRNIGICFFLAACVFCIYGILTFKDDKIPRGKYTTELKFVNIFNRHGDRAPSDPPPQGDPHTEMIPLFWPNGLHNLTDLGKYRQYRLGLELRRLYDRFIGYDSSQVLAFSSPILRCIDSLEQTLRGLYNIEWTRERGLLVSSTCRKTTASNYCHLPSGRGAGDEWKRVKIDTKTVPSLVYDYLNDCKFRKEHPSPVDADLLASKEVRQLPGVDLLKKTIMDKYNQSFSFPALGLWSTIGAEINIVRTEETIKYASHYLDWVNRPIASKSDISLYDLYEQVAIIAYRDRVVDEALYVQIGPAMTSMLESQTVALSNGSQPLSERAKIYKGKKMVFYSSHDSIMQLILHYLGIINLEGGSYELRYKKWRKSDDEVGKLLAGLKMSEYGMSIRFELYETKQEKTGIKFPYIQVWIYNKAEAKFSNVEYKLIPFGSICKRQFFKKYAAASKSDLREYYDTSFIVNEDVACPFKLFQNITADMMVDEVKLQKLCDYK